MKITPVYSYRDGFLIDASGRAVCARAETVCAGKIALNGGLSTASLRDLKEKGVNLLALEVDRAHVEPEPERYDEAFLAGLRLFLKSAEADGFAAVFSFAPAAGSPLDKVEPSFVEAAAHMARRVKDCACVLGFLLPDGCGREFALGFAARFAKKHPAFVFFLRPRFFDALGFSASPENPADTLPFAKFVS